MVFIIISTLSMRVRIVFNFITMAERDMPFQIKHLYIFWRHSLFFRFFIGKAEYLSGLNSAFQELPNVYHLIDLIKPFKNYNRTMGEKRHRLEDINLRMGKWTKYRYHIQWEIKHHVTIIVLKNCYGFTFCFKRQKLRELFLRLCGLWFYAEIHTLIT